MVDSTAAEWWLRRGKNDCWTPAVLRGAGFAPWGYANVVVALAYFALAFVVSRFFSAYGLFPAPIWLPTGVAVVAAMAGGWRLTPGVFVGSFVANWLLFAPPFYVTAIISLTNALGPLIGTEAARYFRPPTGLFTRFTGVAAFIACTTLLSPAISATGGTIAMGIAEHLDHAGLYSTWVGWWLTDSGGTLYIAPAMVLWLGLERVSLSPRDGLQRRDFLVWIGIAALAVFLFSTPPLRGSYIRSAFPFLLVVPLSWVAFKMSLRAAYTLVTLVSIIAAGATVAGFGPFHDNGIANPLQLVGVLVVLLATNVLTVVALFCERREAQEASKVKSRLLANMSHELRTPLNAIIGFSEMMDRKVLGPLENNKYEQYVGHILTSGNHLLSLINDVLDMAKIEEGRLELFEETIQLAPALEEAASLIEFQASAKSIAVELNNASAVAEIRADAKALRQVILNLLSNAVKFTGEGGRVTVAASKDPAGNLLITVSDNGIGIEPEAVERVFLPFEQAEQTGARKSEGTGLGLSITRGLIALHGGRVTLDSAVGEGTVVTVLLPASRIVAQDSADRERQHA